jgi:hypothetical protein
VALLIDFLIFFVPCALVAVVIIMRARQADKGLPSNGNKFWFFNADKPSNAAEEINELTNGHWSLYDD